MPYLGRKYTRSNLKCIFFHQPYHQVIQELDLILPDGSFQVFGTQAAVVGDKNIRTLGSQGQVAHQKLGLFINTTGRDGDDFYAFAGRCAYGGANF